MAPLFHVEALLPSSISPKIDSILHSHIYRQVGHVFRAVARFRALLVDVILSKKRTAAARAGGGGYGHYGRSTTKSAKRSGGKKQTSKIVGFVKMHFVGTSFPPARARDRLDASRAPCYSSYYDYEYAAEWNAVVPATAAAVEEEVVEVCDDTAECGYLCWLEEERSSGGVPAGEDDGAEASPAVNEIDRLAEKFIARFHAKFLLEKQESYRRYQEMIARSI
ncbi:hypothetical protein CFC21_025746 [Triticum aestivum]|uniref:Uncharacterized protein n=2 Tax=Triticum aestivum TaxID=4565 RepID=A0A9R1EKJ5_WHEAT|nr:uncharacterized protein LOC119368490 [Triticum dicoccoides]XP_044320694.1 uncharacterized protein LOC123042275 [Triticum aestivum]KAF7011432.1 hypothetical protein CFC21_025746 [Triticum aestivum]